MTSVTRPLRADARRNRDRLLAVAVEMFQTPGDDGSDVTLEAVARGAGVGIGTLYRHFPTREALVEAAYRQELQRLCDSATDLIADLPADRATRAWFEHFLDYMTTKRGMAAALKAVAASGVNPFSHSKTSLIEALQRLLDAGAADGTLRSDVLAADVLTGMSGLTLVAGTTEQRAQVGRLLDLLVDGLRLVSAGERPGEVRR